MKYTYYSFSVKLTEKQLKQNSITWGNVITQIDALGIRNEVVDVDKVYNLYIGLDLSKDFVITPISSIVAFNCLPEELAERRKRVKNSLISRLSLTEDTDKLRIKLEKVTTNETSADVSEMMHQSIIDMALAKLNIEECELMGISDLKLQHMLAKEK